MKTSVSSVALAFIGVASLAFAIPLSVARAQEPADPVASKAPDQAAGPLPGGVQDQRIAPGFPGEGRMVAPVPQMRNGMGGATMVADGDSLYILQGARLFKVSKGDLRVTKEGMLPMERPMQPGGGGLQPGAPARGGGGQGGGDK